ncbi:unnamed protein product [Blepharisma stoltei]|uniref:Uncharacterized protein n=1 Tax=Blepharisma stoltei TaxID=1481888 RepID=A0AAU9IP28_9CILI|nr:unnamed protein product [Blepharisma stoltei]
MWQPHMPTLQGITKALLDASKNKRRKPNQNFWVCLDKYKDDPYLSCYLMFMSRNISLQPTLRNLINDYIISSLKLKREISAECMIFMQQNIVMYLDDPEVSSYMIELANILYNTQDTCPQIIELLSNSLDSNAAIRALTLILNKASSKKVELNTSTEALRNISQKLISQTQREQVNAIYCMNNLIALNLQVVDSYIISYLDALLKLNNSELDQTLEAIASGFLTIGAGHKNLISARIQDCSKLMIKGLRSKLKICCEFWKFCIIAKIPIYPSLLSLLEASISNLIIDSSPSSEIIRNCSIELLELLAPHFKEPCFTALQEFIDSKIHNENWIKAEAAIKALACLSNSGNEIHNYVRNNISYIMRFLQHDKKQLISTVISMISVYPNEIIQSAQFKNYIWRLLNLINGNDKEIGVIACSALLEIIKTKPEEVNEFSRECAIQLLAPLEEWDKNSLDKILEPLYELVISYNELLDNSNSRISIFAVLFDSLRGIQDDNPALAIAFNLMIAIIKASSEGLRKYLKSVLTKAQRVIEVSVSRRNPELFNTCLYLIIEILKSNVLKPKSYSLVPTLEFCLNSRDNIVLENCLKFMINLLGFTNEFDSISSKFIYKLLEMLDVRRNSLKTIAIASEALGNFSIKYPEETSKLVPEIAERMMLAARLNNCSQKLRSSIYLSIGMLGLSNPNALSTILSEFAKNWIDGMRGFPNDSAKINSFRGIYESISLLKHQKKYDILIEAYKEIQNPPPDLQNKMGRIALGNINQYKK